MTRPLTTTDPKEARRMSSAAAADLAASLERGDSPVAPGRSWSEAVSLRHPDADAGIDRGYCVQLADGLWVAS